MSDIDDYQAITADSVHALLSYDPTTGIFRWASSGDRAEYYCEQPRYRCVRIHFNGTYYLAHRVAWLYVYGHWPEMFLDHINQDEFDNRICNLRLADFSINGRNRRLSSNNTSGFNGVSWIKRYRRWAASIKVDGKTIRLGSFRDLDAAIEARQRANIEYGFHENHGRKHGK